MSSLLSLVETLLSEPSAKAEFAAAPEDFLASHGFDGLEPADVAEALHHAADTFPPRLAAELSPDAGFEGVAQVDLAEIGLAGPGDFSALDPAPPAAPLSLLGRDVDFDFDHEAPAVAADAPPSLPQDPQSAPAPAETPTATEGADQVGLVDSSIPFSSADAGVTDLPVFDGVGQFGSDEDPFDLDDPGAHVPAFSFEQSGGFDAGDQDPSILDVAESDDLDDFGV